MAAGSSSRKPFSLTFELVDGSSVTSTVLSTMLPSSIAVSMSPVSNQRSCPVRIDVATTLNGICASPKLR